MKIKAEKIKREVDDMRLTITDNQNITIQVIYSELRKELNKAIQLELDTTKK